MDVLDKPIVVYQLPFGMLNIIPKFRKDWTIGSRVITAVRMPKSGYPPSLIGCHGNAVLCFFMKFFFSLNFIMYKP